jgi:orotate phosphoribosyltransferase
MAWRKRRSRLGDLAEGILKAGALQFGTFTLPDGRDSAYYVNLRGIPSYTGLFGLVVDLVADTVRKKAAKTNALCGVPLMGLAIASPVAVTLKMPLVYTRVSKQVNERLVEGEVRPGWKVVVIADVATSGESILSAAESIINEGGEVKHAVALIDRMEGAREKLSKKGIALHSVTDMLELADALYSTEMITKDNLMAITKSIESR